MTGGGGGGGRVLANRLNAVWVSTALLCFGGKDEGGFMCTAKHCIEKWSPCID